MLSYLEFLFGAIVSNGVFLVAAIYLFQQSFQRALDKSMESFKQELQVNTKARELLLKSQIDFRERQLGEFYGPIYALLMRGKPIYTLWSQGRLEDIDEHVSKLFVDANEQTVKIILEKSHLVDGDSIPESFTDFLTHVAIWHGYLHAGYSGIPITQEDFPKAYFPADFEREVFATTERLKRELSELHIKYDNLASRSATQPFSQP